MLSRRNLLVFSGLFFTKALGLIVFVDVAVLAFSLRVHLPVAMFTLCSKALATIPVVAVITHALSEMLEVSVAACCDNSRLPAAFTSKLKVIHFVTRLILLLFLFNRHSLSFKGGLRFIFFSFVSYLVNRYFSLKLDLHTRLISLKLSIVLIYNSKNGVKLLLFLSEFLKILSLILLLRLHVSKVLGL